MLARNRVAAWPCVTVMTRSSPWLMARVWRSGRTGPCEEGDSDMADRGLTAGPHGERHAAAGPAISEGEALYEDRPARGGWLARMVGRGDDARWPVRVVDNDMTAGRWCDHHGHGRAGGHGYRIFVSALGVRARSVRVHRV